MANWEKLYARKADVARAILFAATQTNATKQLQIPAADGQGSASGNQHLFRSYMPSPKPIFAYQQVLTKNEDRTNNHASPEWWLVYVTVSLCLITGVLAFFTAKLFLATKSLVVDAENNSARQSKEMQDSIAATSRIAEAGERQINLVKASSERQLRAYVFAERLGIGTLAADFNGNLVEPPNPNTDPFLIKPNGKLASMNELTAGYRSRATAYGMIVEIQIRNFGLTPAWKFKGWFGTGILEFPTENDFPDPPESFPNPVGVIAPGATMQFAFPLKLERAIAEDILAQKRAVFAYGRMEYWDAFDNRRTTSYRVQCLGPNLNMLRFHYSLVGNEAT